jgi:hypothetical protein
VTRFNSAAAALQLTVNSFQGTACSSCSTHLWQVQVDLIAIEVGVECGAVGVVHADCALTLHMSHCSRQYIYRLRTALHTIAKPPDPWGTMA